MRLDCGNVPPLKKSPRVAWVEMLKILIVDDSAPIRLFLGSIINQQDGLCVCGEASNGAEGDLAMPVMNGINAATHINRLLPGTHLVMFTSHLTGTVEELARSEGIEAFVDKGDSTKLLRVLQSFEAGPRAKSTAV
jgi:CheY-like chemotaxis protein